MQADEREESGARALLNLGHTFGHALEAFAGYSDRLLHGEAIAIGMRQAFAFSAALGLCDPGRCRPRREAFRCGRPADQDRVRSRASAPTPAELLQLMAQDKKVKGGKLAFVLVRGVGEAYLDRASADGPADGFSRQRMRDLSAAERLLGRERRHRQRMDAAGELLGERLIDHAVAVEPRFAGKGLGHHEHAEMALARTGRSSHGRRGGGSRSPP